MGNLLPPFLHPSDTIRIIAPAGKISPEPIELAKQLLTDAGFNVQVGEHVLTSYNSFAGTDDERAADMQAAIDDSEVKAIFCARGGYGSMRTHLKLDWQKFIRSPKWIIGYSDITTFHSFLNGNGVCSIHGTMPVNFSPDYIRPLSSVIDVITGSKRSIEVICESSAKNPAITAEIVGGNLSILNALAGTSLKLNTRGKLLFIEEIDEYLYNIDRMLVSLKMCGYFDQVKGVVIGGFTNTKDNADPFGKSVLEMVKEVAGNDVPVWQNFPAGHVDNNMALVLGQECRLEPTNSGYIFSQ